MSFGSSHDAKEQIKRAIDIVDLVGSYIQLRREGRGYKGLCPWHDDRRPSLQVNPERQSFKCWVCDIGGDVFQFVMKHDGVTFPEALAMLAERAGIELKPRRSGSVDQGANQDEKRALYQAMAWAEQQFHQCLLQSPEAEAARRYLAGRGITAESVQQFHLGFAPDSWDWIQQRAKAARMAPQMLERTGVIGRRQSSPGHYDRFKGRVLFSIRDLQGRPVALGGRVLPELAKADQAKYINSPESPLFSKSNMLYGLDAAREAIHKTRTAIVMEGYTDCLIAHQCGFKNAVAVLGTALGERHVRLLSRFADRIVLVLDGDDAGQRRTNEVLELFVAEQVDLRILTLPGGLDPCDYLLQQGAEAFARQMERAVDALDHKFQVVTGGLDFDRDTHQAHQALEEVLATLAKAPRLKTQTTSAARLKESQILHRLARQSGVAEETLRQRLTELRRAGPRGPGPNASAPNAAAPEPTAAAKPDAWEHRLFEILLLKPELFDEAHRALEPDEVRSPACRDILAGCRKLWADGLTPTFERLMLEFEDPSIQNLLVELDELGQAKGSADPELELRTLLDGLQRKREDRQRKQQTAALRDRRLEEDEQQKILEQIIAQKRNRQGISVPTDG